MIQNLHIESFGLCWGETQEVARAYASVTRGGVKLPAVTIEVPVMDWLDYLLPDRPPCVLVWWKGKTQEDKIRLAEDYVQAHYTEEDFKG